MRRSKLRISPATVIALVALFVALGGVGIAANGGNLVLGQGNSATAQTSLSAPVSGGRALQLTNNSTGSSSTALGLSVASGHPPFTVNSSVRVPSLNADRVDGLDASAFALKKDSVRMFEPVMDFGTTQAYDIGPYIRFIADCYSSAGTTHLDIRLLNDTPGDGFWRSGTIASGLANPGTALSGAFLIHSGDDPLVTQSSNPSPNQYTQIMNQVHGVWTDGTGEAITATYGAIAWAHYCDLTGTLIRTS